MKLNRVDKGFMGWTSFLLSNQQHQSTKGN